MPGFLFFKNAENSARADEQHVVPGEGKIVKAKKRKWRII